MAAIDVETTKMEPSGSVKRGGYSINDGRCWMDRRDDRREVFSLGIFAT